MGDSIYTTLSGLAPGGVLALPATTFGTGPFEDAISGTCDGQVLRATVAIEPTDSGARLTGTGSNAPFTGMHLDATFVRDATGAGMTLTATPIGAWSLASAWPLLANSFAQSLGFTGVSLTLGTGTPGQAAKGLAFQGTLGLGALTPWSSLSWLFAELGSIALGGPVTTTASVPVFTWTAPIRTSVTVPGLAEIQPTLTLNSAAAPNKSGPPYGPRLGMALLANIPLGPGIPVAIDVSDPSGLIAVEADPSAITSDVLVTLSAFLGQELGAVMPKGTGFDPSSVVTLQQVGFALSPAQKRATSAWIELGTPAGTNWPIAEHITIEGIGLEVVVPFGAGTYSTPFVTAFGTVTLPGGALQISGSYGDQFLLAAGLTDGSKIKITDLLDLFLPTKLDAELYLDELDMTAVPGSGAWSLMADLTGDWGVQVGVVNIALTDAGVSLDHDSSGTTGTITATAVIAGDTTGKFTFTGTWALPETFVLSGTFPDIDLTSLAARLTGHGPPSGAPVVELTDTTATLTLEPATSTYDFSLTATAETQSGTTLGAAAFDVRKDTTGFGFLIGFDLPAGWSPADLWSPLGTLFGSLTFENSGMVFSTVTNTSATLANLHMASVPATVGPGITFFTSLKLVGGGLGYLGEVLPAGTELDLLGLIDTSTPANSTITAELTEPASHNALQFRDAKLTIQPATTTVIVTIDAILTVGSGKWAETVTISGGGSLQIEPQPDISLLVDIKDWAEPFGIEHLVVNDFGLRVNLTETAGLDIGLAGEVTIGQGDDDFSLSLGIGFAEFEVPDWFVFDLEAQPGKTLMLPSLIATFVPALDLSKVPVLNQIGFAQLELYIVEDPSGIKIGDHTYPQGIGLACDVTLYSWELKLCVEVNASKGIKAAGSVNHAIDLFGVLTISDVTGTTGPSASINTASLMSSPAAIAGPVKSQLAATAPAAGENPPTYLCLDGKVSLLGVSYSLDAKVTKNSFDFDFEFQFLSAVTETIKCSLENDKNFSGSASFTFDLDVWLGPWTWEGIELMPRVHIAGPTGSVSLSVTVNPTVIFDVGFRLVFDWGAIHVSIAPHLTAIELKNDLEQLWSAVVDWMEDNLDDVWSELKADATKWAAAIESGLFDIAADADAVAQALKQFFDSELDEAASVLNTLGYGFEEAVKALVHWFEVSLEEAAQALGDAVSTCAMDSANDLLGAAEEGVPAAAAVRGHDRALFDLTTTPKGQRILRHWYVHGDELQRLVRANPRVRERVRSLSAPESPEEDARAGLAVGVEVLYEARQVASSDLREAIDEVLPELERRRGMTWDEFMADLRR